MNMSSNRVRRSVPVMLSVIALMLMAAAGFSQQQGEILTVQPRVSLKKVKPEAEKGDLQAIYLLGVLYQNGSRTLRPDYRKSETLYTICAEHGIASAQYYLAQMYYDGTQIPQNDARALRWYRAAALQGLPEAQYSLGTVYEDGRGTSKDPAKAAHWYTQSALQGYPPAENKLGDIYASGKGVATNLVEACKWYSLAAANGMVEAATSRDALRSKMTRDQIARAQREASLFVPVPHFNINELRRQREAILKRAKEIQSGPSS